MGTTQFASSVSETGFVPPVSLEAALARTLRYEFQEDNSDKVQKTLEDLLPHAQLQEEHYTQMKYQLPVQSTKLPLVFRLARDSLSQFFRIRIALN